VIHGLEDEAQLDAILAAPTAVLYKHSPRCGACVAAEREVTFFAEGHPDVPVHRVDVVRGPELARTIARRLGVPHESPQVILLHGGRAVWWASHWEVRALDLEERAGRRRPAERHRGREPDAGRLPG
jgi:bacillithiol system protein YtxJ